MTLGLSIYNSQYGQIAYFAILNVALTSAMRSTFWRAFAPAALGTPNSYTRGGPLVVPISASRVACYSGGNESQLPVGYSAGFTADGNPGQVGVVCEEGATFLSINTTNMSAWGVNGGATVAAADGPSGMRDGIIVTMPGAGGMGLTPAGPYCFGSGAGASIANPTNVPFALGGMIKRGTVGTTFRLSAYFSGDPGGPEGFNYCYTNAAVPVDWASYFATVTPLGAFHNLHYHIVGSTNANENCNVAEAYSIKNRAVPVLAWRRTTTPNSAATSTATHTYSNTGNRRYNPARGTLDLTISGWQAPTGGFNATFWSASSPTGPGCLWVAYVGGQLQVAVYDAAGALAATVLCGPLTSAEWRLRVSWDHANPVPGILGQNIAVERINPGASPTLLGTWAGGWTVPVADVTPISVGSSAGVIAARCLISVA
jgi:hypothetical protein